MRTQTFESKSSPGTFHTSTIADSGEAFCTCNGWKFSKKDPKQCTHTKAMLGEAAGKPISKTLLNINLSPVRPMLATPLPAGMSLESYDPSLYILEEKYNGHRRIVDTEKLTSWSRVGLENLIPAQILPRLRLCRRALLDSELYYPGGLSTDTKALANEDALVLVVFDVLEIEASPSVRTSTVGLPQMTRRMLLQEAVPLDARNEFLQVAPQHRPSIDGLQAIWDRGGEGAILKLIDAPYEPGKRSRSWIKLKKFESYALRVVGFAEGLSGPFSTILLEDENGIATAVKSKNDAWRAAFAATTGRPFINSILMIECQGRTESGSFTSPMADHFFDEKLARLIGDIV